jgi:hypothetical protein
VLLHEESVEEREADPVVVAEPCEVDPLELGLRLLGESSVLELHLAALAGAELSVPLLARTVDLGEVPPMGDGVDVGRRQAALEGAGPVRMSAANLHRVALRPLVVLRQRYVDELRLRVLAVTEPVVVLELDPAGRKHVERCRRLEGLAVQQPGADLARTRVQQARHRLGRGGVGRGVAAEAGADHAHLRIARVLEGAVVGPVLG